MTQVWRLDNLPSEVILLIFDYCHAFDLVRLSEVCRRFYEIIRADTLWMKKSKLPLVTNQLSEMFLKRCNPTLCLRTKWHVSHNWQYGKYEKRILFSQKTKLMPWLQLTNDTLWWSGGNQLRGFKRTERLEESNCIFDEDNMRSDVCKFVLWKDFIVTGHRNGSINFWTKDKCEENHFWFAIINAHSCDINAIDTMSNSIISGSDDGMIKIRNMPREVTRKCTFSKCINVMDRVWSLAANPAGARFAVGLSGNSNNPPLRIYDIERYSESDIMQYTWRRGAGILDMVWDNPYTLLTCGYDTYVRKWDLRTGTCISSWADPTDATLYCISSDYQYSIVAGAQFNSKAVLWDQRQKNYIQLYFMNVRKLSSPIYSLRFDSTHLYCATDRHMVELTFSGRSYKEANYKELIT